MNFPVELSPEIIEKAEKLRILPEDIVEKFVRGSGSGGQKINKTSSTVWIKHLPTGIEAKVQRHRERDRNRKSAYKLLINKMEEKVMGKKSEIAMKVFKLRKQKQKRTKRAKEKMLQEKAHRSVIKAGRSKVKSDE